MRNRGAVFGAAAHELTMEELAPHFQRLAGNASERHAVWVGRVQKGACGIRECYLPVRSR